MASSSSPILLELTELLARQGVPLSQRNNVSSTPVPSITLGAVPLRSGGYTVSRVTGIYDLRLLTLLVRLPFEAPEILGRAPVRFTSVCVNVNYAAELHKDKYNTSESCLLGLGDYTGGELFIANSFGKTQLWSESTQEFIRGDAYDVRHHWCHFSGKLQHAVLPFEGFRASLVYFTVPVDAISPHDRNVLRTFGFPIPCFLREACPALPLALPFHICICSTRRAHTLASCTLRVLLRDASISPAHVTVIVADDEDARVYADLGISVLTSPEAGLAQQRVYAQHALQKHPWLLFVDDDVSDIKCLEHVAPSSLAALITGGFESARGAGARLWGLNTSSDARNLRHGVSTQLGLVNGYFFGLLGHRHESLEKSTRENAAAEDIERSLRYFLADGVIVRLNFATAIARTWSNAGGLQSVFTSRDTRREAHARVLDALVSEFPNHLRLQASSPNGCAFLRGRPQVESPVAEFLPVDALSNLTEAADVLEDRDAERRVASCPETKTLEKRGDVPVITCPLCNRLFGRERDMRLHLELKRCGSKRGKHPARFLGSSPRVATSSESPSLNILPEDSPLQEE